MKHAVDVQSPQSQRAIYDALLPMATTPEKAQIGEAISDLRLKQNPIATTVCKSLIATYGPTKRSSPLYRMRYAMTKNLGAVWNSGNRLTTIIDSIISDTKSKSRSYILI